MELLLERGTDAVEAGAEPWATPRAWAEKMKHDNLLEVRERTGPKEEANYPASDGAAFTNPL